MCLRFIRKCAILRMNGQRQSVSSIHSTWTEVNERRALTSLITWFKYCQSVEFSNFTREEVSWNRTQPQFNGALSVFSVLTMCYFKLSNNRIIFARPKIFLWDKSDVRRFFEVDHFFQYQYNETVSEVSIEDKNRAKKNVNQHQIVWRNFISFSLRQLIRGESIVILDINRHNETLESIWIECKCKNGRQQQQNFTLYSSYVFVVIQWICVTYSFSLSRTKHSVRALASILLLFLVLCFFMLAVVRSAQFFFVVVVVII